MIQKLGLENLENKYTPQKGNNCENHQHPSFRGIGDGLITAVQLCEKYPMVNVSALDLSTAIIPRTIIETKESNGHAGFEAFRRESSGLIVNCLIPSFIVMGVAKLLKRPIMGDFKKSSLVNTWANSDAINKIHKFYNEAGGSTQKERVFNTFRNQLSSLSGVDGFTHKEFADIFKISTDSKGKTVVGNKKIEKALNSLTDAVMSDKLDKKAVKNAYKAIIEETHIAENIKFKGDKGYFSNNLESVCDDTVKLLRGVVKENITDTAKLSEYFSRAKKLVNWKSIGGLGLIIPLAISMQPINRWITHKTSGQKGAPIYKDFGKQTEHRELTPKEKTELLSQKFVSVASMIGVCALSMFMDKPSLKMFQFKGFFPTMDQARIISTATFASRMGAAEDVNELREATVRDIATFSSLYFLGDYVAKGIATLLEKMDSNKGVHLINRLGKPDKNANALKRFWYWAKHTSLKSSDELVTVKDKKLRTICQIGNIAFSLLALGVFIPLYTRAKTNRKHAEELARLNAEKSKNEDSSITSINNPVNSDYNPLSYTGYKAESKINRSGDVFENLFIKRSKAFKQFINSQGVI